MNKMIKYSLLALAIGALAVSCADYNETTGFTAEPDPTVVEPYKDLKPVKSYIDRNRYPNMSLGALSQVSEFNKQELAHAAAVTNFDNVAFGTTLMSGNIVNAKGVMNFLDMIDLLDHVENIGGEVFGSPIVANANQAEDWLKTLTAPIEIVVEYVEGKEVNFNDMSVGNYGDYATSKASIVKYDNQNVLKIGSQAQVNIIDGFEVDPLAKYTTTFWAKADKDITFDINFSGNAVTGSGPNGKWLLKQGKWTKFTVESQSKEDVTDGFMRIETARGITIYIQKVQVGYYPDNHRPQTAQELNDTIHFAINAWCDGLMKYNEGRIKSFDLIDEPIDAKSDEVAPGIYDIKHGTEDKIFWQDIFGSEEYAPTVSKVAKEAFEKYGGDPAALKFFISETGLEDQKTFESLKYWIEKWEGKGAKIDGINAKVSLIFSENAAKQADNEAAFDKLLDNLKNTGKLIRISNFDILYQNADGKKVSAKEITTEQRQKLADYYGALIKKYMTVIAIDKQAGICKANIVDTGDPVGLWAVDSKTKDWVRTATYKAFCDALRGE
jgi:hypothetical protein